MTSSPSRRAATVPVLMTTIALAAAACGRNSHADSNAASASLSVSPENILVLAEQDVRSGPNLSGDLSPERLATLRAELGGSITSLTVEVGQAVRRGQVLAVIDDAVAADQLRSARSGLVAAEHSAQVARRELDRARRLAAGGAMADRDVETAERALLAADAQLENTRAMLAGAEKQYERTRLRAPFDGIVSERLVSTGDVVQPGDPLFTVMDPSSMRLTGTVPVSALGMVAVGSPVDFDVSGYAGRTFAGRVERINPVVDPGTRQVRLVIAIPNAGRDLVAGLYARGRVTTESRRALAVPMAVLDLRGSLPTVRRLREGRVEVVAVQVGLRDEVQEIVEITAGLAAGDTVLVGGAQSIAAGTSVVIRKE